MLTIVTPSGSAGEGGGDAGLGDGSYVGGGERGVSGLLGGVGGSGDGDGGGPVGGVRGFAPGGKVGVGGGVDGGDGGGARATTTGAMLVTGAGERACHTITPPKAAVMTTVHATAPHPLRVRLMPWSRALRAPYLSPFAPTVTGRNNPSEPAVSMFQRKLSCEDAPRMAGVRDFMSVLRYILIVVHVSIMSRGLRFVLPGGLQ